MVPTNEQLCAALKQGDHSALDTLIEQNMAFLRRMAYNLANQFKQTQIADDLVQEGAMALMEAAERFDPERGTLFLTYAGTRVFKAMRSYLDFIIAAECVSLDEIAEAGKAALMVLNEINYVQSPESWVLRKETTRELFNAVRVCSKREQTYISYRFGYPDGSPNKTLKETAAHFHLTESRAKKLETLALDNVWLELPWWYDQYKKTRR